MKSISATASTFRKSSRALAGSIAALLAVQTVHGAALTWDVAAGDGAVITDGSGTWTDAAGNWNDGVGDANWANATPDSATLGGGSAGTFGTVTLGSAITAGSITFATPFGGGAYTINTSTFALTLNTGITANESGTIQSGVGGGVSLGANNAWSVGATKTLTVASDISGTGFGITKSGTGTLLLSGTNTYDGETALNGGVLALGSAGALGTVGTISFGGGKLQFSAANTTDYSARFSAGAGQAYNLDTNGQTVVLATALTSTGGTLTKTGAGALTLSNTNTYTGLTTVTAGTLNASATDALGTGADLLVNGGTLAISTFSNNVGAVTLTSGSISGSSGTLTGTSFAVQSGTISASLAGVGATLTKTTVGTVTLSGANTYDGGTTVNAGTLALSGSGTLGSTAGGLTADGATSIVDLGTSSQTVGAVSLQNGAQINNGTLTGTSFSLDSGSIGANLAGLGAVVTVNGVGPVTLTGNNTYDGGTVLNGGSLTLGSSGAIGTTGTISFPGGGLKFTASNTTDYSARFDNTAGQLYTLDTNGQAVTIASALTSLGGTFTKKGAGTLTVSGLNTYDGQTTISTGTLKLGNAGVGLSGPLGDASTGTVVNNGGALDLNGFTLTTAEGLTLNGTGVSSGGALTNSSSSAATYSGLITLGGVIQSSIVSNAGNIIISNLGAISGSGLGVTLTGSATGSSIASILDSTVGGLSKTGPGTWALTGANAYDGATTISQGALRISNATGAGSTVGGTTVSATGAALQLNGVATSYAAEALAINGSGINSAGALENVSGANIWGTGPVPIVLGSASTIGASGGSLSIVGGITVGTNALTFAGAGNVSISTTAIAGTTATLTKIGTGTLTFSNVDPLTGNINVNAGTLALNSTATTNGNLTVNPGAALSITDNSAAPTNNRLNGKTITLNGGAVNFVGNNAGNSSETTGALTVQGGQAVITATAAPGRQANINFNAAVVRLATGGTVLFRGSSLGTAAGAGIATIQSGTGGFTFVGQTGATGTTNKSIVPWAIIDTSPTGLGTSFATTDAAGAATTGVAILRPLNTATEMVANAYTSNTNVRLTGAQPALAAGVNINSLTINSGNVTITPAAFPTVSPTLTLGSGGLLTTAATSTIGGGILALGGNANIFTPGASAAATVLTINSVVTASAFYKAGAGTVQLNNVSGAYPGYSGNVITGSNNNPQNMINEGVVQLGASNAFVLGHAAIQVNAGGTLDLNGNMQYIGALSSQFVGNTTVYNPNVGVVTADGTADATTAGLVKSTTGAGTIYLTIQNSGATQQQAFSGSIQGASVGVARAGEGTGDALILRGNNTYGGPTLFAGGQISTGGSNILRDDGRLTGTSRIDVNYAAFVLDNTGLAYNGDRVRDAADIGLRGGTLYFLGRAQTPSSETLGAVTLGSGHSTIIVTPGSNSSADLTLTSLARTAGSGATVTFDGTTLGSSGNTPHINISGATVASLTSAGLMVNNLMPWAVIGNGPGNFIASDFASYIPYTTVNGVTSGGVGAMGSAGYAAYDGTSIPGTNQPTQNIKVSNPTLAASVQLNSLNLNGSALSFSTGNEVLNLTSGGLLSGQNNGAIGATVDSGRIAAGGTDTSATTHDLYVYQVNNGVKPLNARIIDTNDPLTGVGGSGKTRLVIYGGDSMSIANANNSYTGGTVISGTKFILNNSSSAVVIPNATTAADGLVINKTDVTLNNSPGQIGSGNIVTLNGSSNLNLFGNNTLAGLVINNIGGSTGTTQSATVNTTPSAFGALTNSTGITLALGASGITTTSQYMPVDQINSRILGRVSMTTGSAFNIGATKFNGQIVQPFLPDLTLAGVTGSGAFTKSGDGVLQFAQPTTLSGTLDVTLGTIQVGNGGNAGARLTDVTLQNGTRLNLNGSTALFGSLAVPGTGVVTNTGAVNTLTVGFTNASTTFAGSFLRVTDNSINLINLTKIGTGTMTLSSNTSTASGTLTLNSTGGGGLAFKDNGVNNFVSGTVTVNVGSTLTIDNNSGLLNAGTGANVNNRLASLAASGNQALTLTGGTYAYQGREATASSESMGTGVLTLGSGESNVTANAGGTGGTSLVTFGSLTQSLGGTATFAGTNLATASNKIIITSAPGLTGNILPRLAVGTEFATYNQDGLGVANTNGVQAISAAASSSPTDINTALTSANLKLTPAVTTRDLTAARTVNSVNIADNSVNIGTNGSLLPTQGLLISTGAVIVNGTGAVISTPVTNMNAEGIFRVNSGQDLTVNSRLGSTQALTKTGSGSMTIGRLADYIGTTTVNQGLLKFGTGIGSNPLQVSVTTGAPTVQTLQMNGGTLDLNGNKLLVGTINGSNNFTGGTITNTAGGSAVTLTSLNGGSTFGGKIAGNLNFTLAGNNDFRGAVTILKDEQSYTGATVIRSGGLTLQDKGALYVGVSLTNASVELNNATLLFDNASLSTTAAGPTRLPSTVPITLKAGTIAVKPGASADTITSLGTVTVGAYYNNILSNQTVNQGGISLSNSLGGTNTLTIGNLTTSNTGGIVSFGKYSNQNGGLVDSQAQRVFVTQVNGNSVAAGSGWSNGATGMLPAWAMIAANAAGTGNTTGLGDFATLSSTGFGIVAYGDTSFGAPAYLAGTTAGANFSTGSVTSIGAGTMAAGNYLTGALKATGGLSFTAATDTMNIESGGFSAGGTIGATQNNGQLTAGGSLPTTGSTVDLYVYNSGILNSKVIDNPNNGGAKVRLIIANVNNTTAINGNNTHTGGTVIINGREGQYAATLGSGGVIIPAGGLTLVSNLNNSSPARILTAPTGSINPANDVTLAGGNVQLTMTGTNTLASLIFEDGGEGVANAVVNTATNLILSKTTAQGSAINSMNDNIGGGIPTVAGTLLTLQDGATITTSGEAPVSLSITAPLAFTGATSPLIKAGSGSLLITGTNTYANGVNLNAGTIILSSTANAGIGTGPLTIADGTALMGGAAVSINNLVNVANNASFTFGTLDATNARATASNNVTLTNTVTLGTGAHTMNVNGLLMTGQINGQLTGGTNFTKAGPGTLILNNATNNFGGTITISGGTLQHNLSGSIPTGRIMTVASGAAFNINAISQSIDSLNGAGSVINPGAAAVLTINGTTNGSFSGVLAATTAANLSVVKNGVNSQIFSGANVYGGATTITAGTLVAANAAALGTIAAGTTVASGASLDVQANIGTETIGVQGTGVGGNGALVTGSGTGTVGGTVTLAANTSIGGAGTLNINGVVAAGAFTVDKVGAGTTNFGTASTLTSMGTLNATAGTTNVNSVLGTGSSAVAVTGATFLKFGSVSQTLASLSIGAGSTVTFSSGLASFTSEVGNKAPSFGGGSAVVPEPGTIGLLLVGALGILNRRRRVG